MAMILYKKANLENYRGMKCFLLEKEEKAIDSFENAKHIAHDALKNSKATDCRWYLSLSYAQSLFGTHEEKKALALLLYIDGFTKTDTNLLSASQRLLSKMISKEYLNQTSEMRRRVFLSYGYDNQAPIRERTFTQDLIRGFEEMGLTEEEIKKGNITSPILNDLFNEIHSDKSKEIGLQKVLKCMYPLYWAMYKRVDELVAQMRNYIAMFITFEKDGNHFESITAPDRLLIAFRDQTLIAIFGNICYFNIKTDDPEVVLSEYIKRREFYTKLFLKEIFDALIDTCKEQIELISEDDYFQ